MARTYTALLFVATAGAAYTFSAFLGDFILALIFAALARPFHAKLAKRWKGRTTLASAVAVVLLVVLVAVPISFLIASLANEAAGLYESSRNTLSSEGVERVLFGEGPFAKNARKVSELLGFDYSPDSVKAAVGKAAGALAGALYERVNAIVANLLSAGFHFVMFLLIFFYLLEDGDRLRAFVRKVSPLADEDHEVLGSTLDSVGRAILVGNVLASALQGLAGAVAFMLFGLPSFVLWGTVMSILAFLPMVGISAVTVPATIYLGLVEGRWISAGFFFAFTASAALILDNVVKTRMMGTHMKMHDALIFMSVIGGLATFGLLGILYGPLVIALFLVVAELYAKRAKRFETRVL
ncbi:MAG: AI-2E family transporter [Deltaproteobacteria bacterium]|nr:AI-2E family transporter [Deltaproteobacteria bacterium]